MSTPESEAYRKAAKRVKAKRDFYSHLASYLIIGLFFLLLNAATSWGTWWFYWPMLGWGIGLMFHYIDVFGVPGFEQKDDADWEERAIREEMRKMGYPAQRKGERTGQEDVLELREMEKEKASRRQDWDEDELV